MAVVAMEGKRARVVAVSAAAAEVTVGLTAPQAMAVCPAIELVERDGAAERETLSVLLACCWSVSPRVQLEETGRATLDLTGVDRATLRGQIAALRARLLAQGVTVAIGIAPNPLVARFAAERAQPERWVDAAGLAAFLAPLPVCGLGLSDGEANLCAALGLKTLGDVTALPRAALADRFGARGDALWRQAAGEWDGGIQAAAFPQRFQAELELEEPVETLEPLLFVLRRFTERLATEISCLGHGAQRLALRLTLENDAVYARDFDLPEPSGRAEGLFAVLEHHLAALRTDAPIVALTLEAFPAQRLEQQGGLFDTGLSDATAFFSTLGRLAAVVGNENVGTPRHADTHRPDAIELVPPATAIGPRKPPEAPPPHGPLLRRFRPPAAATVELTEARPTYVASAVATGPATVLRRPFWASGHWADPPGWAREEWDVQIGPGLYRLCHEPDGWRIEGVYD